MLEKEYGWREEEFDFVLQFMRTILLKRSFSQMLHGHCLVMLTLTQTEHP